MGSVSRISNTERLAAFAAAVDMARTAIGSQEHHVRQEARIGELSLFEWDKLASALVSGWIIERSRQLVAERLGDEPEFLALGETPEPYDLGTVAAVLGPLADLIEKAGLSDRPIGAWSKHEVCLFVWTATELVLEARTKRDERPGSADVIPFPAEVMAG